MVKQLKLILFFQTSDYFYKENEKIFRKNLILEVKDFNDFIKKEFKSNAESGEITFEGLAYHIIYNTKNIFHDLHKIFPKEIQS